MTMTSLPLFSLLLNILGPLCSLAGEGRGERSHDSEIIIINISDWSHCEENQWLKWGLMCSAGVWVANSSLITNSRVSIHISGTNATNAGGWELPTFSHLPFMETPVCTTICPHSKPHLDPVIHHECWDVAGEKQYPEDSLRPPVNHTFCHQALCGLYSVTHHLPGVEVPVETGVPAAPFDVTVPPDGCQKSMTEYFMLSSSRLNFLLPRAHFLTAELEGTAFTPERLPDMVLAASVATTSGSQPSTSWGVTAMESFCSL